MTHFKGLLQNHFDAAIATFDETLRTHDLHYYLIGAQARDVYLLRNNVKPSRATNDIDFAVMLPDFDGYNQLIETLCSKGFIATREPYRVVHAPTETVIDILPFGQIEEHGTVHFLQWEVELSTVGLMEVYPHAVELEVGSHSIHVAPLEGLVLLKLIAHSEKPHRKKDLDDIQMILSVYLDANEVRFFAEHIDITTGLSIDNFRELAAAQLLGRDIGRVLKHSPKIAKRINDILVGELQENVGTISAYFLSSTHPENYALVRSIFLHLNKGFNEGMNL